MKCTICGNTEFVQNPVLKERLVREWKLNKNEVAYINKQQGLCCTLCKCNLRSMTLAKSILEYYKFSGTFQEFCGSKLVKGLNVLEINEAGGLNRWLKGLNNYEFGGYPTVDIQNLPYKDNTFDFIVHSDTLEHVEDSAKALSECYRVLKENGSLFYTIPIIFGGMSLRRDNLEASYHGSQDESQGLDYKVITEYGADFWVEVFQSGFSNVKLSSLGDLSSISISAFKIRESRPRNYFDIVKSFIFSRLK